jgi:hypothetical protein
MKPTAIRIYFILLLLSFSHIATGDENKADICSPRYASSLKPQALLDALIEPINEAIAQLDNANIQFASPSLASGAINYVTITPDFADDLNSVCILGYFQIHQNSRAPLQIDHIEKVKIPNPSNVEELISATRIYFNTPSRNEFYPHTVSDSVWEMWNRHQSVDLKIAAFRYQDNQRVQTYFGHTLDTQISSRHSSTAAALLFACICYLIAAFAIPPAEHPERLPSSAWKRSIRKLAPWQIAQMGGKASLSQLQLMVFTLIVTTLLFYQWLRTGILQEISTDLLYLIGISATGAGGSQITDTIKKNLHESSYDFAKKIGWFSAPLAGNNDAVKMSSLLITNKRFDMFKFQMLVFTIVIAFYVTASGANELANIKISPTLLSLMGMSQGAYMVGKASSDSLGPLHDQLSSMRIIQQQFLNSHHPEIKKMLIRRYATTAQEAADMFSNLFARDIPKDMLALSVHLHLMSQKTEV